jgi:hypothetical protein
MKNLNLLIQGILIIILISSCEKEKSNDNQSLIGKWTFKEDYSKTFDFQNSTDVLINGQEFLYKIEGDSIEFSYNGHLYIAVIPSKHKYEKLSDTDYLMIENLNKLQFFNGNEGENILLKGITPNDFIGYWINVEQNDTLIFLTNERLERPHGYCNDWYDYSITPDSIILQYSGPDKLLVPKINFGYDFKGDTLLINYHQDYYPNLTSGLKKYLRK